MDTIRSATFPPGATGKLFVFKIMKVGLKRRDEVKVMEICLKKKGWGYNCEGRFEKQDGGGVKIVKVCFRNKNRRGGGKIMMVSLKNEN